MYENDIDKLKVIPLAHTSGEFEAFVKNKVFPSAIVPPPPPGYPVYKAGYSMAYTGCARPVMLHPSAIRVCPAVPGTPDPAFC